MEPIDFDHLAKLPLELQLPKNDVRGALFVTASCVLFGYFGLPWVERHVLAGGLALKGSGGTEKSSEEQHLEHAFRVMLITEALLNLQGAPTFDHLLSALRSRGVTRAYAEFVALRWLRFQGAVVAFRQPGLVGEPGYDLDIEIEGLKICGATRGRVETGTDAVNAVLAALDTMRASRLPPDKPGLAVIAIPPDWFEKPGLLGKMRSRISAYLKTSDRLVAVALNAASLRTDRLGAESVLQNTVVTNPASQYFDARVERLAAPLSQPGDWVDIVKLWEPQIIGLSGPTHSSPDGEAATTRPTSAGGPVLKRIGSRGA
ncbi:hypothetical protein BH09PSE1_BH09PSE1_26560 [soil metagenome]